ncbi:peptidase S8/S53 subtilisin kexin sedolisin [Natronococcus pandeyae]|uniref:Peptidase S8/S53 subtilisin kexin sedolisin n=1 Tax=Natronococcus pandeyae TaxID=2055836 RepID=A0A8J8Q7H8_9EURY|nr:S8 family serine peptidase [Natronococcus pandeyae]TYL39074.1 peptidase S8/S53 subtilisin kexin sedolisin [Natronococcus pandeyae]
MSLRLGVSYRVGCFCLAVVFLSLALAVGPGTAVAAGDPVEASGTTDEVSIDPELEDTDGDRSVIVQFEDESSDDPAAKQADVETTQRGFQEYANATDGVAVERQFWITDATLVTVDTDRVSLAELAALDGVSEIRTESVIAVSTANGAEGAADDGNSSNGSYAPGLEQSNVSSAWDTYHTRGDGASVAVLDSGVDGSHPDLEVAKWNDFGDAPAAEPTAYDDHGTHVSGVVAGGNESGTHVGVAPDADLYHGAVMTDCERDRCVGYERHILAGIEWAVEEAADVAVLSLGWDGYSPATIDAIENANDAGTLVVASSGNEGEGNSTSPGNVYDAMSVGAVDESGSVPDFSGGETIETREAWGTDAPDRWPESYTVPTVVAPGTDVESTVPDGGYETKRGTSMAAPSVGGTAALVQSATAADLGSDDLESALTESATVPADREGDVRYGHGVVDAAAAIDAAGGHATLEGTATDTVTGDPLANASVVIVAADGTERETTTDSDGTFEFTGLHGEQEHDVTVEHDGYEPETETTRIPADETTEIDVALAGSASIDVTLTDAQFGDDVEDATVVANGTRGTYPAKYVGDGTYRIEHVPRGEYDLLADAPGYVERDRVVTVTAHDRVRESFELEGDATLEVAVETQSGEPVENASITLERSSGSALEPDERTDENGTLTAVVAGVDGSYSIEVSAPEFETTVVESGPVETGSTGAVTVSLSDTRESVSHLGALAAAFALVAVGVARLARS